MPRRPRARRRLRLPSAPEEWTRRKLQAVLVLGGLVAAGLVVGAVLYGTAALQDTDGTPSSPDGTPEERAIVADEDVLAQAPLPAADPEQAQPGPLATTPTGTITLPAGTGLGPAGVPTGFPHTPEGAMAQLIGIDRTALESASVARAQEVIAGWAQPGGPTQENWSGVTAVATFLTAADLPATGSTQITLQVEPAMGVIKGTIGVDFVVPCVDFVLTLTTTADTYRTAVADCQRMSWTGDRWMIAAGDEPAPAPSLWPGTDAAIQAGYQWLETRQ